MENTNIWQNVSPIFRGVQNVPSFPKNYTQYFFVNQTQPSDAYYIWILQLIIF